MESATTSNGPRERDQWLKCMEVALERVGAPDYLRQAAKQPFFLIADTVRNRDESGNNIAEICERDEDA